MGQGTLTRPAHANAVQILRSYKVEVLWPSNIKLLKDGSVKLGQLDVLEQPEQPQGARLVEHVWRRNPCGALSPRHMAQGGHLRHSGTRDMVACSTLNPSEILRYRGRDTRTNQDSCPSHTQTPGRMFSSHLRFQRCTDSRCVALLTLSYYDTLPVPLGHPDSPPFRPEVHPCTHPLRYT